MCPLAVVAIDMPISLPDRGHRQADVLARAAVGSLSASVFMTLVRKALLAADHAAASAINRELTGHGISVQAFGLKPKLLQVEQRCSTPRSESSRSIQKFVSPDWRGLP